MTALISVTEFQKSSPDVLLDARGGPGAFDRYKNGHLEGALFVDLDTELSSKGNPKDGGRHPLPSIEDFARLLTDLGLTKDSDVVVYDDKSGGMAAARLWWMLRAAGISKAKVLDGGFQAAVIAGMHVSTTISERIPGQQFHFEQWQLPVATMKEVEQATQSSSKLIIDVREAYRFNGESEPIDLVAGHIPNAINIPFNENLASDGKFLPADQLNKKYSNAIGKISTNDIIIHCGSGVTACHTLLALEHAGLKGAKLYVGSWSEWSRNDHP